MANSGCFYAANVWLDCFHKMEAVKRCMTVAGFYRGTELRKQAEAGFYRGTELRRQAEAADAFTAAQSCAGKLKLHLK